MKVLFIGATGLLGKPVINQLSEHGFELVLMSRNIKKEDFEDNCSVFQGDVMKKEDLEQAMKGCDVIHISISTPSESLAVKNVLEVAAMQKVKLISYVSGATVWEENRNFAFTNEKFLDEEEIKRQIAIRN